MHSAHTTIITMPTILANLMLEATQSHVTQPKSQLGVTDMFSVHTYDMKLVETTGLASLSVPSFNLISIHQASHRPLEPKSVPVTVRLVTGPLRMEIIFENLSPLWAVYARI